MPPREPHVSIKAVRGPILAAATLSGRSPVELIAEVGLQPQLLGDADARIPHSTAVRVWDHFAAELKDDSFGLFAAQLLDAAPSDLVDYMLQHAVDLRDLWSRFGRYQSLFHDANDAVAEVRGSDVVFVQRFGKPLPQSRHLNEFIVANWLTRVRRALGRPLRPTAVRFRHPAPRDDARHLKVFDLPVTFDAAENALVVPAAVLDERLPAADPALRELLARQLDGKLREHDGEPAWLDSARAALRDAMLAGQPDIDTTARALAMSVRSLQRRLGAGGSSFRALLDDVRRELALAQMGRQTASVTDVAFLLGFSEVSAFSRAFRRWTGASPAQYRRATP